MSAIVQAECETDFNCNGTLVCYTRNRSSWLPEGVSSTCDCSTFWGWTGPQCDGFTAQVALVLALSSFVGLLALFALSYNVRVIVGILRLGHTKKWNSSNATLAFTTVALVSLVLWRALTFAVLVTPSNNTLKLSNSDEKLHLYLPFEKVFIAVAVVTTTLSAISVSVSWIDIAKKSSKLLPASRTGAFADHRRKVYVFGFLFCCAIAAGSSQARTDVAVIAALPFVLVIIMSYVYAQHRMSEILQMMMETGLEGTDLGQSSDAEPAVSTSPESRSSVSRALGKVRRAGSLDKFSPSRKRKLVKNRYMALLGKVRLTSRVVIVSLTLLVGVGAWFAFTEALVGWRDACPIGGTICTVTLGNDMLSVFVLATAMALQKFIYDNFKLQLARLREMRRESSKAGSGDHLVARRPSFLPATHMQTASPRLQAGSVLSETEIDDMQL